MTDWTPVFISLKIAFFATLLCIIAGVPLAWLLARRNFPGKNLLSSAVTLPMVLPPTVLGYYLLVIIGRQSFIGRFLNEVLGIRLVFTWQGAVLAACIVALPLLVRSVQAGFEAIDQDLEDAARTLGKKELAVFMTITLPLGWKSFISGMVLAFARSLGEFGATLMVAGNIPGKTQTLSIAIYDAVQGADYQQANFLVVLISVMTITVIMLVNHLSSSKWR